jgi:hypothetical protein
VLDAAGLDRIIIALSFKFKYHHHHFNDKSIIIEGQMRHRPGRGFGGGACGQHFDFNLPKYNGRVPTPARPAAGKKTAFLSTTVHYAETDYFPKTGSRQT